MSGPLNFDAGAVGWTEARVALLRRHFAVGLTAAESAILLGGVSKNAVIAKRARLGLFGITRAKPGRPPKAEGRLPSVTFRPEPDFKRIPLPPMDSPPPSGADPKPLARHRRGECVWPLGPAQEAGDWRTLFCCAPAVTGRRYCPTHGALARR